MATTLIQQTTPESAMLVPKTGICLEPRVNDGDMVLASPSKTAELGDLAVVWFNDGQVALKIIHTPLPADFGETDELMPVLIAKQLNPPRQLLAPADWIRAVHGVLAVKGVDGWQKT